MIKLFGFVILLSLLFTVDNNGFATVEFQPGTKLSEVISVVTQGENIHYRLDLPKQHIGEGFSIEISRSRPITPQTLQKETENLWGILYDSAVRDGVDRNISQCWTDHTCDDLAVTRVIIEKSSAGIKSASAPFVKSVQFISAAELVNERFFGLLRLMSGRQSER